MNFLKKLNLFWSFCVIFIYSYLPQAVGVPPFFITIFFQGTGILISFLLIFNFWKRRLLFKCKLCNLLFLLWICYFLRLLYSYLLDNSLPQIFFLEKDFLKVISYSVQIGLLLLLLPAYNKRDFINAYPVFYKCLFFFILGSIYFVSTQQNYVEERADANSYIPTLLYGQYGVTLMLLSIYNLIISPKIISNNIRYVSLIGVIIGFVAVSLAASRAPFISLFISLFFLIYFWRSSANLLIFYFRRLILLFCVIFIFINVPIFLGLVELISPVAVERLSKSFLNVGDSDLGQRDFLVKDSFNQFIDDPLFGSHMLLKNGLFKGYYPHNSILEFAISLGVLGVLIYLFLIIKGLSKSLFSFRVNDELLWVCIIFIQFLTFSLSSFPLYRHSILFASLVIILSKIKLEKINIKTYSK